MVLLVGLDDHLKEGDKILVEVATKNAKTWLHDLDGKLDDLIQIHELVNDVWDEYPDLFEKLNVGVYLTLREFLTHL